MNTTQKCHRHTERAPVTNELVGFNDIPHELRSEALTLRQRRKPKVTDFTTEDATALLTPTNATTEGDKYLIRKKAIMKLIDYSCGNASVVSHEMRQMCKAKNKEFVQKCIESGPQNAPSAVQWGVKSSAPKCVELQPLQVLQSSPKLPTPTDDEYVVRVVHVGHEHSGEVRRDEVERQVVRVRGRDEENRRRAQRERVVVVQQTALAPQELHRANFEHDAGDARCESLERRDVGQQAHASAFFCISSNKKKHSHAMWQGRQKETEKTFVKWFKLEEHGMFEEHRTFTCSHGPGGQEDCANEIEFYEFMRVRAVTAPWVNHIPRAVRFSRSATRLPQDNVQSYHPSKDDEYSGRVAYIQLVYIDGGRTLFDILSDQRSFDYCFQVATSCFEQIQPVITGLNLHGFRYGDLHAKQYVRDSADKWWLVDLNVTRENMNTPPVQFPRPDDMFKNYMNFADPMVFLRHMSARVFDELERSHRLYKYNIKHFGFRKRLRTRQGMDGASDV